MCAWCTTFNPRCFIGDRDSRHESDLVDDVSTISKYEFSESRLQIEMHDQVSLSDRKSKVNAEAGFFVINTSLPGRDYLRRNLRKFVHSATGSRS